MVIDEILQSKFGPKVVISAGISDIIEEVIELGRKLIEGDTVGKEVGMALFITLEVKEGRFFGLSLGCKDGYVLGFTLG